MARAREIYARTEDGQGGVEVTPTAPRYYRYPAIRMFFDNGGGACWILSLGGYDKPPSAEDYGDAVWDLLDTTPEPALCLAPEPALCLAPDAVSLDWDGYKTVTAKMVAHCAEMQSRFAILDLYGGAGPDLNDAIDGFRKEVDLGEGPQYAAIYALWLNTTLSTSSELDFRAFDMESREALKTGIVAELQAAHRAVPAGMQDVLATLEDALATREAARLAHNALLSISQHYKSAFEDLLKVVNLMPPGGAIACVYAMTDNSFDVWKAPAKAGLISVVSPAVAIDEAQQQDMNVPLDGKAVNAIRTFIGRGVLVWGARTLDGNSQDWRYINVRRTMIMLEQSIKSAAEAFVFEPNDASTWAQVQSMIENFLNNQWKAGALAGATPKDAYAVSVGLGSTMSGQDILDGYMRVTVKVAVVRPAEFIVITFQQKMQTS